MAWMPWEGEFFGHVSCWETWGNFAMVAYLFRDACDQSDNHHEWETEPAEDEGRLTEHQAEMRHEMQSRRATARWPDAAACPTEMRRN